MKINVSFEVPDAVEPVITAIAKLAGLTPDAIGQRLVELIVSGNVDADEAVSLPFMMQTFPELAEKFAEMGMDASKPEEFFMGLQSAMVFMSVADRIVEPCEECGVDKGRLN
ncbi:hypothetical protein JQ580_33435 [Bradyrhizobium japonicum]|uniref:hypothetical protein n=1 Tax=Bradyrhizobium japonicum TaxID=375 RepID=UPI001BA4D8DC|nr:hypothetical protein [Bradyrhizobium japonicum]MBR0995619.1 hypothetical protein [Bradyrhizobium japonicum]